MDSDPKTLGYDKNDGPTKNKDGYFNYNSRELQWGNNISEGQKKYLLTESAIDFIEKTYNKSSLCCSFLTTLFTPFNDAQKNI